MDKEELRQKLEKFVEKNDFKLNPDEDFLNRMLDGLISMEEKKGLKVCPCRIGDGTKEKTLGLLCPCNFKSQPVWNEQGRCWCGLFVKR